MVMQLTVSERAKLASRLLDSLPLGFDGETDTVSDSDESLTSEELKRSVGQ